MNKKKFMKIFFPILGAVVLVGGIYGLVISLFLKDYQNLNYIDFKYEQGSDTKEGAIITGINSNKNYPAYFEVPKKVLGRPVVGIGDNAFYGLDRITTIVLPASVTSIGDKAFGNCPNLEKVIVKGDLDYVGIDIFEGSDNWEGFDTDEDFIMFEEFLYKCREELPSNSVLKSIKYQGVGEESANNFVYIPENVKGLCSGSFKNQPGLVKVEMPDDYVTIENDTFFNCVNLSKVVINDVTSIGDRAFAYCLSLDTIDLKNIDFIGAQAFDSTNLGANGEVVLSDKLEVIGERTFANCANLTELNIPNSVTKIDNYAFENDTKITEMNLSENITFLGNGAFKNTRIQRFVVPNSINAIQNELFMDDVALKEIILPEVKKKANSNEYTGIVTIGERAFANATALQTINFPTGLDESNNVKETLTSIRDGAFMNSGLTSIKIPSALTKLDKETFSGCANLETVEFAENSKITAIDSKCFKDDVMLESISFPDTVSSMQDAILSGCTNLQSVKLPNNKDFKTLNGSFFEGCTSLESVVIPESIVALKDNIFKNCTSLKNVQLLGKITAIGTNVFENCSSLSTLELPSTLRKISANLFGGSAVTSIVIPESVTAIDEGAFLNCTNLTSIIIPEKVTTIGENAFKGCANLVIYCEATSKPSRFDENWNPDNVKVYWGEEWELVSGVPTPIVNA